MKHFQHSRKPPRVLVIAAALICMAWAAPASGLDLSISGDQLTLHVQKVPLQDILRAFARLGVAVQVDQRLNPEITASFENTDIRSAFNAIIRPHSYVLVWKQVAGPLGSLPVLAEIRIFEPGREDGMRTLDADSGFTVVRDSRNGTLYVQNELLIRVDPRVRPAAFKRLLEEVRGTLIDANAALGIYRIRLPDGADISSLVDGINNGKSGARAEPNLAYPLIRSYQFRGSPTTTTDLPLPESSDTAGKAPVAVLDSGLIPGAGVDPYVVASLDSVDPRDPISDPLGHGTQMAMIAAGLVAPYGSGADSLQSASAVIPVKIFDERGYTSNFTLIQSLDFALQNGARIISLSWGTEQRSAFLEKAMARTTMGGAVIVASAGNEPTGKPVYPAAYDTVIGVGALAPDGKAWDKSNHGSFVSLYAPGFASFPVGYKGEPGGYAGTSIAAAYVARRISDFLARNPKAKRSQIYDHLGVQYRQ